LAPGLSRRRSDLCHLSGQDFEDHVPIERFIPVDKHAGHPAAAEFALDPEGIAARRSITGP